MGQGHEMINFWDRGEGVKRQYFWYFDIFKNIMIFSNPAHT